MRLILEGCWSSPVSWIPAQALGLAKSLDTNAEYELKSDHLNPNSSDSCTDITVGGRAVEAEEHAKANSLNLMSNIERIFTPPMMEFRRMFLRARYVCLKVDGARGKIRSVGGKVCLGLRLHWKEVGFIAAAPAATLQPWPSACPYGASALLKASPLLLRSQPPYPAEPPAAPP